MTEATFVLYAPKQKAPGLRAVLAAHGPDAVRWREKRHMSGSEFYLSGPSRLAREAHQQAAIWLTKAESP